MHAQQMAAAHPGARGRANDALERACHQAATATGLIGPQHGPAQHRHLDDTQSH